jgi:hypothetical protein
MRGRSGTPFSPFSAFRGASRKIFLGGGGTLSEEGGGGADGDGLGGGGGGPAAETVGLVTCACSNCTLYLFIYSNDTVGLI